MLLALLRVEGAAYVWLFLSLHVCVILRWHLVVIELILVLDVVDQLLLLLLGRVQAVYHHLLCCLGLSYLLHRDVLVA